MSPVKRRSDPRPNASIWEFLGREECWRGMEVGLELSHRDFVETDWHFFVGVFFILVLVGWEEGHCNLHSCSFEKSIEILFWWYADEDMLFRRIRMLEERKLSINNSCGRSQGGCSNHPEVFRWLPWHRSVKLKQEEAYLSLCRQKNPAAALLGSFVFFLRDCCLVVSDGHVRLEKWSRFQKTHESGWIFNF